MLNWQQNRRSKNGYQFNDFCRYRDIENEPPQEARNTRLSSVNIS